VNLDLEKLHEDLSIIDEKYNEEKFLTMCKQTELRLQNQNSPKEARIGYLNWFTERLMQMHKETLHAYQIESSNKDRQEIIQKQQESERIRAERYVAGNTAERMKMEEQEEEKTKVEELIKSFKIAEAKKQKVIGAMTGSWGRTANAISSEGKKPMVGFIRTFENGHFRGRDFTASTTRPLLLDEIHSSLPHPAEQR
jgi:hypothetical protein